MIPRVFWVPDTSSLATTRERIVRATRTRFASPVGLWLRLYDHDAASALEFLDGIRACCESANVLRIVAMRVDLAIASDADGVHLPSRGIGVDEVRTIDASTPKLVGVSCHDESELERAARADYVTVSPVFDTPGKGPALGLDAFARLVGRTTRPVVALGGITESVVADAVDAGAHGVAVRRTIDEAPDPSRSIDGFLRLVDRPRIR